MEDLQNIKRRFEIIGNHEGLNRAIDIARQVAPTDLSVLISGESGVGKEVFPRIIHQFSIRKHANYIAVNCGAIPEGTIDSELFGHEKGSFTGALGDRQGYFEVTNEGTIFLDEVGELPLTTQARLLRVLESGEFIRVGSSKVQKTNVRVIAATNVDIPFAIKNGKFREDLFYRLNAIPIFVPPLRERKADIALLFRKFASDFAEKYRMPAVKLSEEAVNLLLTCRWPGNIRQLKNVAEQVSIIEQERFIDAETFKKYLPTEQTALPVLSAQNFSDTSFTSEREILYKVLFDMKADMNDLKQLVYGMLGKAEQAPIADVGTSIVLRKSYDVDGNPAPRPTVITKDTVRDLSRDLSRASDIGTRIDTTIDTDIDEPIQDTVALVEEGTFSLNKQEKELIVKALEKNGSKRKLAANDLGISERTLYRKLKEYGLE
ncbi:sigma-54-dependent Fis family transcriptional regulator [Bacteroidia bacterium]|nr:sigma-54-dependent Fis family transcriptional regulator [Bacteroidia bacterium]